MVDKLLELRSTMGGLNNRKVFPHPSGSQRLEAQGQGVGR